MHTTRCFLSVLFFLTLLPVILSAQSENPFPAAAPESQGMSQASLDELADVVQSYFERELIVGAELLVIKNRRTILHEAFGWRDLERKLNMELNTIFNLRSMTKPFTGAAIQILIDEGKLGLDDRAAEYIPGFSSGDAQVITIEQLLTHRSGLPLSILTSLNDYDDLYSMAIAIGENGTQFKPGSKFWYSDAGTEVLGAIVEEVSGQPLDRFIRERLLEPLGMEESFSYTPTAGHESLWERVGSIYYWLDRELWIKFWMSDGKPFYPFAWGSQSLYSTPRDYARFIAMWMDHGEFQNHRVLSEQAVARMLMPVSRLTSLGSDTPMPTGFPGLTPYYGQMSVLHVPTDEGVGGKPEIIGHSGSDGTIAWGWPDRDLIVMYFTQSRGGLTVIRLETDIDRLLIDPVKPEIPDRYKPYIGDYSPLRSNSPIDYYSILYHNNRLALDIPGLFILELNEPDSQGKWRTLLDSDIAVSFTQDNSGIVTEMRYYEGSSVKRFNKIQSTPVLNWSAFD